MDSFVFPLLRLHAPSVSFFFFFNDTATTEIYTLSLHDALPISIGFGRPPSLRRREFPAYPRAICIISSSKRPVGGDGLPESHHRAGVSRETRQRFHVKLTLYVGGTKTLY